MAASCYGYACHQQGLGSFSGFKKWIGAKHRQNPRGKLGSVLSTRHREIIPPFSRTITLNKSTLELLTKKTVNVAEWSRYSFDLQLKSEVYIHLSQIHLNSVFHNSWHLILVNMPWSMLGVLVHWKTKLELPDWCLEMYDLCPYVQLQTVVCFFMAVLERLLLPCWVAFQVMLI